MTPSSPSAPTPSSRAQVVLAVYSPKGGAGKSTLCLQLADAIVATRRKTVAIVDRDPQGSVAAVARLAQQNNHPLPFTTLSWPLSAKPMEDIIVMDHAPAIGQQFMPPNGTDLVLLPVQPSFLDFASYQQAATALQHLGFKTLMVLNRFRGSVVAHQDLLKKLPTLPPIIRERMVYQNSIGAGQGVHSSTSSMSGVREARGEMEHLLLAIESSLGHPL